MAPVEHERSAEKRTDVERSVEVRLGSLGGFELRPTRLFLWQGGTRRERERVVSFGREPIGLGRSRNDSTLRAGAVEVRANGNPLVTIALAGIVAFRHWANAATEPRQER